MKTALSKGSLWQDKFVVFVTHVQGNCETTESLLTRLVVYLTVWTTVADQTPVQNQRPSTWPSTWPPTLGSVTSPGLPSGVWTRYVVSRLDSPWGPLVRDKQTDPWWDVFSWGSSDFTGRPWGRQERSRNKRKSSSVTEWEGLEDTIITKPSQRKVSRVLCFTLPVQR